MRKVQQVRSVDEGVGSKKGQSSRSTLKHRTSKRWQRKKSFPILEWEGRRVTAGEPGTQQISNHVETIKAGHSHEAVARGSSVQLSEFVERRI